MNNKKDPKNEQVLCSKCHEIVTLDNGICPKCNSKEKVIYHFENSDEYLKKEIPKILEERKKNGLDGLVQGLDCLILNVEKENIKKSVSELLNTTGLQIHQYFSTENESTYILKGEPFSRPRLIVKCRNNKDNPFYGFNLTNKAIKLPNTRIESFIFKTTDIEKYYKIQKERGINFLTKEIQHHDNYSIIKTVPSHYIGCSIGVIQWHGKEGDYQTKNSIIEDITIKKSEKKYLKNIKYIDHTATRVRARDRDHAIIEFMELTNYNFDLAIYAVDMNSITSVTRFSLDDFAMVFTSGITPYIGSENTGPTEKYTYNYGTRVHHIAFHTENIEQTFQALEKDGMEFLIKLVGGPNDGLHQTFTKQSPNTMIVNEYIHRYGDFDGFFTKSNVRDLTKSTEQQ